MPKPTMVNPIIKGETPKFRAIAEVPLTKESAENIKNKKPAKRAAENKSIKNKRGSGWLKQYLLSHRMIACK